MSYTFSTGYMDSALFNLAGVLTETEKNLRGIDFDTIVGTGFSGGLVVPALATTMSKKFVLVRKETDDSHHGPGRLMGTLGDRWVFVDDFISSGDTLIRVRAKLDGMDGSTFLGAYLYRDRNFINAYELQQGRI